MNKSQLVESIATKTGFTKKDSEKALAAVLESVEKALVKGDKVQLIGFGTFGTKKRAARTGRNPQTGATIKVPASKVVSFAPSSALKAKVNKK
ncbi:MAG: HU family DNA-binding protein [Clostridia bacterium]|nr:HU family DNA-binding protein [Clostridia bacterium]MBQ6676642.1 HU family DNA-binding protein [Clostridia bacterium]MBR3415442.1 HU family DNA-binding protein [Clostridia bacterium]